MNAHGDSSARGARGVGRSACGGGRHRRGRHLGTIAGWQWARGGWRRGGEGWPLSTAQTEASTPVRASSHAGPRPASPRGTCFPPIQRESIAGATPSSRPAARTPHPQPPKPRAPGRRGNASGRADLLGAVPEAGHHPRQCFRFSRPNPSHMRTEPLGTRAPVLLSYSPLNMWQLGHRPRWRVSRRTAASSGAHSRARWLVGGRRRRRRCPRLDGPTPRPSTPARSPGRRLLGLPQRRSRTPAPTQQVR
jgi:hypothetical protein